MSRSLALSLLIVAACGDDKTVVAPDAAPDAQGPTPQALAVSGDFDMTGLLSKLDLNTMQVEQNIGGTGAVSGDPVLRHFGDRVYVVNRMGGNNITVYDAKTLAFVEQYAVGAGSNPQDVAVVGKMLYVPALGTAGVVRIDTRNANATLIDLSALDTVDMKPDCVSAYAVANKVYVACGTLDEFYSARGPGKLVVIDSNDDSIVDTLELPAVNPYNFIQRSPESSVFGGDLLVPLLPSFNDYSTGCIARVSTGATPAVSCAAGLTNAAIGGTVIHMDVAPDGSMLWLAVGTLDSNYENPTGSLKGFDLESGTLWETALSPTTQTIVDVAACTDGSVIVSDKTLNAAGLRVYKDSVEHTTAALPIGLSPTFGNALVCYDAATP